MEGNIRRSYAPTGRRALVLSGLLGKVLLMGTSSCGVWGGLTLPQNDKEEGLRSLS